MNFIDDKGRIFGRINILDFLILLFIVIVLIIGMKFLFFQPKKTIYVSLQLCEKDYSIKNCGNIQYFIDSGINIGDKAISLGKSVGEIVDVDVTDSFIRTNLENERSLKKDVLVELKITATEKSDGLYFKNQQLKINSPLLFETFNAEMVGIVTRISNEAINISRFYQEKNISLIFDDVSPETASFLKKGSKEVYNGLTLAEVADFEIFPGLGASRNVLIKARILVRFQDGDLWYKNDKVKVGNSINLELENIALTGRIFSIEAGARTSSLPKIVYVTAYEVRDWIADKVNVGDIEKKSSGEIMAEVLEKSVEAAEMQVVSDSGEVYRKTSPIFKDVKLKIRIQADKVGNELMFHNNPVRAGEDISFNLLNTDISGQITKIE